MTANTSLQLYWFEIAQRQIATMVIFLNQSESKAFKKITAYIKEKYEVKDTLTQNKDTKICLEKYS